MLELQPKDSRGYFMLPQPPQDSAYYVYGTARNGAGQYGHHALLSVIFYVDRKWQAIDKRKFGIGNISKASGSDYTDHASHKDGLQVDIRPVRVDGQHRSVRWFDTAYDQQATKSLIRIFLSHPAVRKVLFNDPGIPGVQPWIKHDDHFHVDIRPA